MFSKASKPISSSLKKENRQPNTSLPPQKKIQEFSQEQQIPQRQQVEKRVSIPKPQSQQSSQRGGGGVVQSQQQQLQPRTNNLKNFQSQQNQITFGQGQQQQQQQKQDNLSHQSLLQKKNQQPLQVQKEQQQLQLQPNQQKPPINQYQLKKKKQQEEEEKQHEVKQQVKQGFTEKPSDKFTKIKAIDPFATKKDKQGSFAYVYNAGGLPCRVSHGTANLYLQWNKDIDLENISFDPLLVTCVEGLSEEGHPYDFIAFAAAKDLLSQENAGNRVMPIVQKLIFPLRAALQHKNDKNFDNALTIVKLLSNSVGPNLNPHLKNLLVAIVKRLNDKKFRDKVYEVLRTFEENGGPDVLKIIKSSVPTYTNM